MKQHGNQQTRGVNMSSDSPLDGEILIRFRASLQQQEHELRQVIDKAEKEVRALTDAGPLDAMGLSCGNSFKESMFAHICQIRRQLPYRFWATGRSEWSIFFEFGSVCRRPVS
jgi:hypothetical protein